MAVPKIWRKQKEHYNLIGNKCSECSSLFFPSRHVCRNCGSMKLDNHQFNGTGNIVTFTVIRTSANDFEGDNIEILARNTPYVLAIIELDEGPRLTAQIVDCRKEEVEIGKRVAMVFRKILEKSKRGVNQYGYKFRIEKS